MSSAKEFSTDTARGIKQYLPEFSVFHVNGSQHSSERKQLIRDFREAKCSIITNARCLTEGIDVPAVDMVAFIDPRHSRIDIAQATGRAMRKPRGSDKTHGYIVVPLFLERDGDEPLEQALKRSEFADVADVLNALQEQDEDLVNIIRELQEAKGGGKVFDPHRLSDKIEVLSPTIELSILRTSIFAEIVDRIGVSWDVWYGRLRAYKSREGSCLVPDKWIENGFRLGQWVGVQRRSRDRLPAEKLRRLDELGFVWDAREAIWEDGYTYLMVYKNREGNCLVPLTHKENGFMLGQWVDRQRQTKTTMPLERREQLEKIGFVWKPLDASWEQGFNCLKTFQKRANHCRVPHGHRESNFPLGQWVSVQRATKDKISLDRKTRLDELGFVWDTLQSDWDEGFYTLQIYRDREGHCLVPQRHKESGFRLGQWITVQRANKSKMSVERRSRLDDIGFVWDPLQSDWEEGFYNLQIIRTAKGIVLFRSVIKKAPFRLANGSLGKGKTETICCWSDARDCKLWD